MKFFLIIFIILWFIYDFIKKNRKLSNKDPKSPWAFPIIGSLYLFGKSPHRTLTKLSKSYGGIFTFWLGNQRSMIVTDPSILKELYIKQSSIYIDRPKVNSTRIFSGDYKDLSFVNGAQWRSNRKLVSAALTKTKVASVIGLFEKQARHLIDSMNFHETSEQPFYHRRYYSKYSMNVVMGMGFSKTMAPEESVEQGVLERLTVPFDKILKKIASGNYDDFIWISTPFYYFDNLYFKEQVKKCYIFLEELYDEHISTIDESNPRDLMDQLILASNGNEKDACIHISLDFLLAGNDTTSTTLEWFSLFMANNPEIQEKAYNELISVVGKDCTFVDSKQRDRCNYMVAVIKETLRIRTPAPFSLLRISNEDYTTSNGVYIPKGTQIIPNLFGIAQNYVDDPSTFKPERWIDYYKKKQAKSNIDATLNDPITQALGATNNFYNDLDNVVLPFSIGIRSCPGNVVGENMLFLACSNILLNFKLSSVDGKPIDDSENFAVSIRPKIFPIKLTKRN